MVKAEALATVVETIVIEDQIDYSQPFVRRDDWEGMKASQTRSDINNVRFARSLLSTMQCADQSETDRSIGGGSDNDDDGGGVGP